MIVIRVEHDDIDRALHRLKRGMEAEWPLIRRANEFRGTKRSRRRFNRRRLIAKQRKEQYTALAITLPLKTLRRCTSAAGRGLLRRALP